MRVICQWIGRLIVPSSCCLRKLLWLALASRVEVRDIICVLTDIIIIITLFLHLMCIVLLCFMVTYSLACVVSKIGHQNKNLTGSSISHIFFVYLLGPSIIVPCLSIMKFFFTFIGWAHLFQNFYALRSENQKMLIISSMSIE